MSLGDRNMTHQDGLIELLECSEHWPEYYIRDCTTIPGVNTEIEIIDLEAASVWYFKEDGSLFRIDHRSDL